jgi:molybdopterin synthase catalytic subunit
MNDRAKVLFFTTLKDKAGVREIEIEFPPGSRITDIKNLLIKKFPSLEPAMETIIVAMNHEYAFDEYVVQDGAELALFPPVSGGEVMPDSFKTIIKIVDHDIEINEVLEQITSANTGAACIFSGIVRGVTTRGVERQTDRLEYEAYHQMAEIKMQQISEEIRQRWNDVDGIAIVQRIGTVYPGKVSVIIICTSSHRDSGIFAATRYGIDRLKEVVPIWKKEINHDGSEWIEGDYLPQKGD